MQTTALGDAQTSAESIIPRRVSRVPRRGGVLPCSFLFYVARHGKGRINAFCVEARQCLCVIAMILTAWLLSLHRLYFICEKYCNYPLVVISGTAHNLKRNPNGYT